MSSQRSSNRRNARPSGGRPPAGADRPRPAGVRPKPVRTRRGAPPPSRGSNAWLVALAIVAIAVVAGAVLLGNFGGKPLPSPVSYGDGTCPTSQPAALPTTETDAVTIRTDLGDIVIEVKGSLSPIAAGNFVALVRCHFYDGLGFHRIVPNFVVQGGDPNGDGTGGPGYRIQDEPVTATYHRGTVAMARTPQPNTQGSQFFIVLSDDAAPDLSSANTYAIFGEVTSGMEVVDAIAAAADGENPSNPVIMKSVTLGAPAASGSPGASAAASPTAPAQTPSPGPVGSGPATSTTP